MPCGTKFLREFIFSNWRFFCVLRELIFAIKTLRQELTEIGYSSWKLIFLRFLESPDPVPSFDNIFVFVKYVQ